MWPFRKKSAPTPPVEPKAGECWIFTHVDGPWPREDGYGLVKIRDVADGWVRYDLPHFPDQRMRIESFVRMYRWVTDSAGGAGG
jgi:hypothetical protein